MKMVSQRGVSPRQEVRQVCGGWDADESGWRGARVERGVRLLDEVERSDHDILGGGGRKLGFKNVVNKDDE